MNEEMRSEIMRLPSTISQAEYLQSLFDLEDGQNTDESLRLSALSYASQLGTTVHSDVLNAANAYYAFLKGETNALTENTDKAE